MNRPANPHAHPAPEAAPIGGPLITPFTSVLGVMVLAAGALLLWRFIFGLASITNLNDGYPWGIWIAWDVVVGSALGAGGFVIAMLVYVLNRGEYHGMIRAALLAGLFGYMQAAMSVIFDLGRWWDFWHIMWPKYAQTNSVLFEVALCIASYILVMWIEFTPVVLERFGVVGLRKRLEKVLFVAIAVGCLLPMMHQSSLGSLLVVLGPQVHPLYQSTALPLLFLTSCFGMGLAVVTIEGSITSLGLRRPYEREMLGSLAQIGRALMAALLVFRFGDLIVRGAFGYALTFSAPMVTFWIENALFATPIFLLATADSRRRARRLFLGACAMAAGGILYRLAAYLIAYDTGPGWHYFPAVGEILVTLGLIAFEVLAILIGIRVLPILPAVESNPAARSAA